MSYTKGKWEAKGYEIITPTGLFELVLMDGVGLKQKEANARRICQCVNNFDDLLEACKRVRSWLNQEHKEVLTKAKCEQILYEAIDKAGNK